MAVHGLSQAGPEVARERRRAPWIPRVSGCLALMGVGLLTGTPPALAGTGGFAGASAPRQTDVASSRGVVPIRLVCPRRTVRACAGTVRLQTQTRKGARAQTLGSARFSIASGKRGKVRVSLNEAGRLLLVRGKIGVVAVVASRDGRNHKATNSRKITVESQSYVNPPPSPSY